MISLCVDDPPGQTEARAPEVAASLEVVVLGRYSPYPPPDGACSGFLVRANDICILVDGGNGVMNRLQRHAKWSELDAVVISHLHPDHIADVHCLRFAILGAIERGERTQRLRVYAPQQPAERLAWLLAPEIPDDFLDVRPLAPDQALRIGTLTLHFAQTRHPVPTYAMRIEDGASTLFYSADTSWDDGLIELARGADLGLIEASLMGMHAQRRAWGHLTAREAALLAQRAGIGRPLLTHLSPLYDLDALLAEAQEVLPAIELAEEGRVYTIGYEPGAALRARRDSEAPGER